MSFIRYKKFGKKEYAYEVVSIWDKATKRPRHKTKYLGVVVDKKRGIYKPRGVKRLPERLILDFGDTYLIYQFLKNVGLSQILERVFGRGASYLLALICYRLCNPGAMRYAEIWYGGNIAKLLFKGNDLSSQRISEFLKSIGEEGYQREFFKDYISGFIKARQGIIIDTTALPNQIHCPLTVWGYEDEGIEKQIKFLFVIDRDTSLPLFFRYLPGNIVDVSSLKITIEELKEYGIRRYFILIDAGFFSEDNLRELYREGISFLTRLPSSRKLYRDLIREDARDLERFRNVVRYGLRVLFIKQRRVELFGRRLYAHIVLDPERRGREITKGLLEVMENSSLEDEAEVEYELMRKGIMILISSFNIKKDEVVPLYYLRQGAEKLFGFAKDDLKLIPLRVHKEETLRGYLFLSFITLVIFALFKKELGKEHTVEEVLMTMRNLKCKVYDEDIIIQEISKRQKKILEKLKIIVPKNLGI